MNDDEQNTDRESDAASLNQADRRTDCRWMEFRIIGGTKQKTVVFGRHCADSSTDQTAD